MPAQHVVVPGFDPGLAHNVTWARGPFTYESQNVRCKFLIGIDANAIRIQADARQLPVLDPLGNRPRRLVEQASCDFRVPQAWVAKAFGHARRIQLQDAAQTIGNLERIRGFVNRQRVRHHPHRASTNGKDIVVAVKNAPASRGDLTAREQ